MCHLIPSGFPNDEQLFFSLYAREENSNALRVISEEFCVALTAHGTSDSPISLPYALNASRSSRWDALMLTGMPEDNALIEKLYTIFTDLTREELASEVYLVCRIFR